MVNADGAREVATFAGGCFWCMEPPFDKLDGVVSTVSGYMGGEEDSPTYQEVSAGRTDHAETVQITFDPSRVSYRKLLGPSAYSAVKTSPFIVTAVPPQSKISSVPLCENVFTAFIGSAVSPKIKAFLCVPSLTLR